ncbi:MAG: hypothetical protein AAFY17_06310 [Cyanobacteria bacterium J06642_11]
MEPSPLDFVSHTHYYRGGDVVIDASVAIAPGVVLRAAANASIRIGAGVCIGAGVVIQAKQGCITIEPGVSLGTGVLIVGKGHVGKDTCVGPSSTLVNPAITSNQIIPPCSLIDEAGSASSSNGTSPPSAEGPSQFRDPGVGFQNDPVPSVPIHPRTSPTVQPQAVSPKAVDVPDIGVPGVGSSNETASADQMGNGSQAAVIQKNQYVYGRDHLNNLLSALFPHRQPLDNGGESPKES